MVVRYGINYVGHWDHMGKGQLVVLTSSLELECGLKNGRHNRPGRTGIPVEWIISPALGYPR